MWTTVFIVSIMLLIVGCFFGQFGPEPNRPHFHSASWFFAIICLCILGYFVLGGGGK